MRALLLLALGLGSVALAQEVRVFTLQDNRKTVRVAPGETFKLRLPTESKSGQEWELSYKNSQLKLVAGPVKQPVSGATPGLGVVYYSFRAEGEFEDSLELRYLKASAARPKPSRTFSLQLRVATSPP